MYRNLAALASMAVLCSACGGQTADNSNTDTSVVIKEEAVTYNADTTEMKGYVYYNENMQQPRPAVLVVPEWWGISDYSKGRAKQLAKMGYIAMAVDMYGDGKTADNPQDAQALATPFYQNPQLGVTRLKAAINKLQTFKQTDTTQMAAIGYCFGGSMVLNAARAGTMLQGVVSFHGGLTNLAPVNPPVNTKILVAHGEADTFVPQEDVNAFKQEMQQANVPFSFTSYPEATHAFTNPNATETGKKFNMPIAYNAAADSASWNDMKAFFGTIFTHK